MRISGLAAGLAMFAAVGLPVVASASPDAAEPPHTVASHDPHGKKGAEPLSPKGDPKKPGNAPPSRFAPFKDATITPGVQLDGICTADFIFSSGHRVFIGYAAHCASADGSMGLNGCQEPTLPVGTPVTIRGNDGSGSVGRLAYSSWITMQSRGETDPALCMFNDFALVELSPEDVAKTNPSVPLFGGPTGLDSDGTDRGERVFSYQPNVLIPTPAKQGFSLGDEAGGLTHRVVTVPPGVPGDSGSGYLDADGEAFGVLSTRLLRGDLVENGVSDLALALDYTNAFGGLGKVRLENGTEPFSINGLRMTPLPARP